MYSMFTEFTYHMTAKYCTDKPYTVCLEHYCAFRLWYIELVVSIEVPLKCAVVSLYSVVKQQLKCNTSKVCNYLIQFLLTMVLSIEECVL
jgi:hypothetical protein